MKLNSRITLFVVALFFSAAEMRGQESAVRPRVVTPVTQQTQTPPQTTPPQAKPADTATSLPVIELDQKNPAGPITFLTPSVIQGRISEARRMLKTRPVPTAMSVPAIDFVNI